MAKKAKKKPVTCRCGYPINANCSLCNAGICRECANTYRRPTGELRCRTHARLEDGPGAGHH